MKKSAIIGMVLTTTMSLSVFAAPAKMMERIAESKVKMEESLYGKDKNGKAHTFASLPQKVQREKQDAIIAQLTGTKAVELRDFLRQDAKQEAARTQLLLKLLAAKTYGESLGKDNAEGVGIAKASEAAAILMANSTRAMDRNDRSTLELVKQSENILEWTPVKRKNVSEIILEQDRLIVEEGLDTNAALVKAIVKVKKISEAEAQKMAKEVAEKC